ncbi:MAG: hypothetical protein A3K19_10025 [Lentisphaerae bacterium RIFOXYB12_FULL_65_16]|nr:MAG: hypothetical protein A3K18_27815 [Lentisphaerae bacterium RIFOXYA12_64_32]OGV91287.1 MAG: hypothetical protein A3K19_10025 [Lentisphaerae bacterium RIFOXYB12_FULL_65_16]
MNDKQIQALLRASSDLVGCLNEDVVIRSILREAGKVVQAESCAVILVDETSDECFFYIATGPWQNLLRKIRFRKELGIAGQVMESGEPALVADTGAEPRHYRGVDAQTGIETKSLLCAPLKMGNRVMGVVEAINKRKEVQFNPEDLHLLTIFSNFAAVAISNARAFDRCRTDASAFRLAADRGDVFLGESQVMQRVWSMIRKVAQTNATVLITGESGTGKEVLASAIHRQGPRRDRPYICVNCAALEPNLLASELFGHEEGAFTGATSTRIGRFELAHGGTLFLDEIADTEPAFQASLLRVLETHSFERLGGSRPVRSDARVIAATNHDLDAAVRNGTFREDLFHRLNVVTFHVPPLRERRTDVVGFVNYFAQRLAAETNTPPVQFVPEALQALVDYSWPGNVREVKNLVERVTVLAEDRTVTLTELLDLFPCLRASALSRGARSAGTGKAESLWDTERQIIVDTLEASGWNQSRAARSLGISRHHLRYRVRKYGILVPDRAERRG